MLKKWIYIFTAFCLFNTIFCFHIGDMMGFSHGPSTFSESEGLESGNETLLDFLIQSFQDDSSDNENKAPLKIKCRHNHFVSRTESLSIQSPAQYTYDLLYVPEPSKTRYANYQIRKASLPSYYNFLFRLNLF